MRRPEREDEVKLLVDDLGNTNPSPLPRVGGIVVWSIRDGLVKLLVSEVLPLLTKGR
jgi:hypothetical protein